QIHARFCISEVIKCTPSGRNFALFTPEWWRCGGESGLPVSLVQTRAVLSKLAVRKLFWSGLKATPITLSLCLITAPGLPEGNCQTIAFESSPPVRAK